MAKNLPSFQFYPQDFLGGTTHLDTLAIGTYLLLLCNQWIRRTLPTEHTKLSRMCKMSTVEFDLIWPEIQDKFTDNGDGTMCNERMETVMQEALTLSDRRAKCGKKGGLAKATNLLQQKGKQKGSRLKYEDRRLKTEVRRQKSEARSLKSDIAERFEEFWQAAPAKVAKAGARKHYATVVELLSARGDEPHSFLLSKMIDYANSDVGKGKYAWQPLAWLKDGHYDDDPKMWEDRNGEFTNMSENERKTLQVLRDREMKREQERFNGRAETI